MHQTTPRGPWYEFGSGSRTSQAPAAAGGSCPRSYPVPAGAGNRGGALNIGPVSRAAARRGRVAGEPARRAPNPLVRFQHGFEQRFARMLDDTRAGLQAIAAGRYDPAAAGIPERTDLATEKLHTLGSWGEAT